MEHRSKTDGSPAFKLTPSLLAMLERIERHSGELLMLAITASGVNAGEKMQRRVGVGLVASGRSPIDIVLLQVSGPDDTGRYNAGLGIERLHAAIGRARLVIAQVNPELPWTYGDTVIEPGLIDILVPAAAPPIELPARSAGPIERTIAEHVARLIPDQATIELGLGAIPEAVTHALGGKRALGVHSGAIGDGIADVMEAGVVDNRHKEIDPGITVATMLMGTRRLYRFANRNLLIRIRADPAHLTRPRRRGHRISRIVAKR